MLPVILNGSPLTVQTTTTFRRHLESHIFHSAFATA